MIVAIFPTGHGPPPLERNSSSLLACVREDTQVKLGGFFGVVIEPEKWRNFVHGWHATRQEVTSDKPTFRS